MRMLERAREARELWAEAIPFCASPDARQFILWLSRFPDDFVERAFMRASRKFSPEWGQLPDAEVIHRYVTSVLLNLEKDKEAAGHLEMM